jgi:hypothetical protein
VVVVAAIVVSVVKTNEYIRIIDIHLVIVVDAVSHGSGSQLSNRDPLDGMDLVLGFHFLPIRKDGFHCPSYAHTCILNWLPDWPLQNARMCL